LRFSSTGQAEEEQILSPIQQIASTELGQQATHAQRQALLVKGRECFAWRQMRFFDPPLYATLMASGQFLL
jgi:hypothetical protein